jgi:heme/copper-type cytochrome/quinol oxidase subunit 4
MNERDQERLFFVFFIFAVVFCAWMVVGTMLGFWQ